jgi:hypothetical protein
MLNPRNENEPFRRGPFQFSEESGERHDVRARSRGFRVDAIHHSFEDAQFQDNLIRHGVSECRRHGVLAGKLFAALQQRG